MVKEAPHFLTRRPWITPTALLMIAVACERNPTEISARMHADVTAHATATYSAAVPKVTTAMTETGFFFPTGVDPRSLRAMGGSWLANGITGTYRYRAYHVGYDIRANIGDPVFAIARGVVLEINTSPTWEYNAVAVLIRHTLGDGTIFHALYGHIFTNLARGQVVSGGVQIGTIAKNDGGNHLHFGITTWESPVVRGTSWSPDYAVHGYVDPIAYITQRTPKCENGSSVEYRPYGGAPVHPNGSLVQERGDYTVYVLEGGLRRAIPSPQRLYELYGPGRGFDFRDVITISRAEHDRYPRGSDVAGPLPLNRWREPDGRLIRQTGAPEIAIVSNGGQRRAFASPEAFLRLGFAFCNVAVVTDYSSYPAGAPIFH